MKVKPAKEQTVGGILLPSSVQSKPQGGEVVAVGDDKAVRPYKIDPSVVIACLFRSSVIMFLYCISPTNLICADWYPSCVFKVFRN